jgi:BirA family transcriptional regulator, biotin operon repressor / biotin---[acetyl-CoA-carboxylase] ligase
MSLGSPRLHLRLVDSTNTRARELAAAGAPHGTLVTASEQRAGRGRQGRTWSAPSGRALLASLIVRDPPRLLPLLAGVAVAEVAERAGAPASSRAVAATVKWPNDVLIENRKVAGILVEGRPQERWAVMGIGLNVALRPGDFPPELRETATTLGLGPSAVEGTLATLLDVLARWLEQSPEVVLDAVRRRDALRGRRITWSAGEGIADGIDGDGRLVIQAGDGRRVALDAGEVHLGLPTRAD